MATDAYVPQSGDVSEGSQLPGQIGRPTIVERTPYGRRSPEMQALAYFFAERGYNFVAQDTRGRGDSQGMFQHYLATPHEGEDGYDLLDWICQQEWSDQTVGTTGMSYTGSNQQSLAITGHPALRCQIIMDAGLNYFKHTVREEGAFVLGQLATYALRMALSSPQANADPVVRAALEHARDHAPDWFRRAPWRRGDSPVSALPAYEDWLLFAQDTVEGGGEWDNPQMNLEPHIKDYPDIPILMITSWYGHHQWATFRKLELFSHHESDTRVLVGTWLHADPYGSPDAVGQAAFGAASSINMDEVQLRWFDSHLRGLGTSEVASTPRVTYFRMGGGAGTRDSNRRLRHGGTWLASECWPPQRSVDTAWFTTSDGRLTAEPGAEDSYYQIRVNLQAPVPTIGSSIRNPDIIPGFLTSGGQNQVELADVLDSPGSGLALSTRHDVATFRTAPLPADTDLTGPHYVDLWLSSDSSASDVSVKIIDEYPRSGEWPNGFALNIAEAYRRCASWTQLLPTRESGAPALITLGPLHLSNLFKAGHRIRLDVTTSNWPRFDRNSEADDRFRIDIHCGPVSASRLRAWITPLSNTSAAVSRSVETSPVITPPGKRNEESENST